MVDDFEEAEIRKVSSDGLMDHRYLNIVELGGSEPPLMHLAKAWQPWSRGTPLYSSVIKPLRILAVQNSRILFWRSTALNVFAKRAEDNSNLYKNLYKGVLVAAANETKSIADGGSNADVAPI